MSPRPKQFVERRGLPDPAGFAARWRLSSSWWLAYLGVVIVGLLLVVSFGAYRLFEERLQIAEDVDAFASAIAAEPRSRAASIRSILQFLRMDSGVQQAFSGSPESLRARERMLAELIPGATEVVLLRTEDLMPGGAATRRLSHAGIEMVHAVGQSGEVSTMQVHRVGSDDAHLAIAGPVVSADRGQVLGVIHVALPLTLLPGTDGMASSAPHFRIEQQVGEEFITVYPRYGHEMPAYALTARRPVAGTSLHVMAWQRSPDPVLSMSTQVLAAMYIAFLISAATALWLPFRRRRRRTDDGPGQRRPAPARPDRAADRVPEVETAGNPESPATLAPGNASANRPPQESPPSTTRERVPETAPAAALSAPAPEPAPPIPPEAGMTATRAAAAFNLADSGDGLPALDLDGLLDSPAPAAPGAGIDAKPAAAKAAPAVQIPDAVFRAYDIRGLVDTELGVDGMRQLGLALGSAAKEAGNSTCVVARDQRPSSAAFCAALVEGLRATGCDVVDLGLLPLPVLYFATRARDGVAGAMVTASHNPAEYNGLKVIIGGRPASETVIAALRDRVRHRTFARGQGGYGNGTVVDDYIAAVADDVSLARQMKIVVDCGHGTASVVAPALFRSLGCEVVELDCDPDTARSDLRMPDPAQPKQLEALGDAVRSTHADFGVAFDADGDRLGVIASDGRFVPGDRTLMLLALDVLARLPGSDIVYDVKCSHHVGEVILRNGGRPVMWKSGSAYLREKVRETGGPFGGELSGHLVFNDNRWNGFDDALYAAARLAEVLALDPRPSADVFGALPLGVVTPELFAALPAEKARPAMEAAMRKFERLEALGVKTIDGLRAEFGNGWGLVRASNTRPGLVFRFEADNKESLAQIQDAFRRLMSEAVPGLALPF